MLRFINPSPLNPPAIAAITLGALCILSAPNSSAAIDSVSSLDLVAVPDPTIACTAGHEVDLAECRLYAAGSIAATGNGSLLRVDTCNAHGQHKHYDQVRSFHMFWF